MFDTKPILFEAGPLFLANYDSKAHVVVNQGGTSSGKTYAIEQVLFRIAMEQKAVITICGQDMPNLKAGALRDAESIYYGSDTIKEAVTSYNKTDKIFYFKSGSLLEFKSYDNAQDAKAGKRDYLFINEANGIAWNIYTELALRTRKRVFIDYNPNVAFWVHDNILGQPNVDLIISDHRHNPFLDDKMRAQIEALKKVDTELWKVYARGITGKVAGLVFSNWTLVDEIPKTAKFIAYGMDFGFTNDETGCIEVYTQDGELWVNELFYDTGLTNTDISKKLTGSNVNKKGVIIADSAEPKSIEELRRLGWSMEGAKKGPDSVNNSIDILKRYKLNVTRDSVNLRNELMRYKWKVDKDGKALNVPVDVFNHLIDPLRYVALNKLKIAPINTTRKLM